MYPHAFAPAKRAPVVLSVRPRFACSNTRYDADTPQSYVIEYMDDPTPFELAPPSTTAAIPSIWTNTDKISARPVSRRPVRRLTLSMSMPWRCLDPHEPHLEGTQPVGSRFHVSGPRPATVLPSQHFELHFSDP